MDLQAPGTKKPKLENLANGSILEMNPNNSNAENCCGRSKEAAESITSGNDTLAMVDDVDDQKPSATLTDEGGAYCSSIKTERERLAYLLAQPSLSESWGSLSISVLLGPPPLELQESVGSEQDLVVAKGCTVFLQENGTASPATISSNAMTRQTHSPEWYRTENLVSLARQKVLQDIELLFVDDKESNHIHLQRVVQRLIIDDCDAMKDVQEAVNIYNSFLDADLNNAPPDSIQAPQVRCRPVDLDWWADPTLFGHSLLRRLAFGLDFHAIPATPAQCEMTRGGASEGSMEQMLHPWRVRGATRIATGDCSFLDLLLESDKLRQVVINALVRRLVKLERLLQTLDESTSCKARQSCVELQQRLVQILNRTQGNFRRRGQEDIDISQLKLEEIPLLCSQLAAKRRRNPWSYSGRAKSEMLKLQQERKSVMKDYEHRLFYETTRRKSRAVGRLQDGTFLYDADDMSLRTFLERAKFMERVNQSIERPFIRGISRPAFKQLNLSQSTLEELKHIFFNCDGSLQASIVRDVDLSRKHGYINFSNSLCLEPRNDKRWQVPLRHHNSVTGYIKSRRTVESILTREGILNPRLEVIHDLGLLIGGTEDQSLHHDIARQTTMWVAARPSVDSILDSYNPVTGWEIDRLEYNEAMSSSCAPCSVLLSLGDSDLVRIGVQRGDIIHFGPDRRKCSVINGVPGEELDVIRENDFLVVVSARGCIFTGDFPHAGVQNVSPDSKEAKLMGDLVEKVDLILAKHSKNHIAGVKAVVNLLCEFPGLNKLCRMHCSTELLDAGMRVPRNSIGFFRCFANPPNPKSDQLVSESKQSNEIDKRFSTSSSL